MTFPALLRLLRLPALVPATLGLSLLLSSCELPDQARQWFANLSVSETPVDGRITVRRALTADERGQVNATPMVLRMPAQSSASTNDTARMLAGLPASGQDYYPQVRASQAWASHKARLDRLWTDFNWRHEAPIRAWAASQIGDLQSNTLFYPFSGPDYLFANAFFPHADTLVLCGLESCDPLPPLAQMNPGEVTGSLGGLTSSLNTVMQFSFFITKDMRKDFVGTRLKGVLPPLLTFMARSGDRIDSVDFVGIGANGQIGIVGPGNARGVLVRANGGTKRVFYFRQDLSDSGVHPGCPFFAFISSLGRPPAFVKSASYLMHEEGFHNIRNYLLHNCRGIVQDPSGVPYRNLLAAGDDVRLYGNYRGTLDMFKSHQQPDLIAAYERGQGQPVDFGIGYLYQHNRTSLMVARPGARISAR